jgi:tetratricopeptide (TPR) repeat protein
MTDTGLPAEPQIASSGGSQPSAPANRSGGGFDTFITVLISMLVTAFVALGVWWAYSAFQANTQQALSTPAGRSIEAMKTAVAKKPGDVALRVRLGEALDSSGRPDEAIAQLQQALKIDPKHTGAWLDLGLVTLEKKQPVEAATYLTKVVTLTEGSEMQDVNQRRETALYYLGSIALDAKKYDDALRYLKGAVRIKRDASDSYLLIAKAYIGQGDTTKAMENLRIAVAFDPHLAEAQYQMGVLYLKQGDKFAAAQSFRKSADSAPKAVPPVQALKALGPAATWVASSSKKLSAGDAKGARKDAETALAIQPEYEPAALAVGAALEKLGDKKGAIQAYGRILTFAPDSIQAKAALKRLGQ